MNRLLMLPFVILLLTSCNKYKVEGLASDAGLDGRMLLSKFWMKSGIGVTSTRAKWCMANFR